MFRRTTLVSSAALAVAALLWAAGPALAGHGGGGGHGGGHGGGGHGGGFHGGNFHGGGFHGGDFHGGNFHGGNFHSGEFHHGFNRGFAFGGVGFYPYFGGYGYSSYYPNYYGYSSYYPNYYGYNNYYPNYSYSDLTPSYTYPSYSYGWPTGLATAGYESSAPAADNEAHIHMMVPAGAEVWFNDVKTKQTGTDRDFDTPELTPGKDYTYDVRVRWMDSSGKVVEQKRTLTVHAGDRLNMDMMPAR
jgi:uncharacterized protein (TIGR03000 family)